MRYHFYLHYGWFLQKIEKDFIPTLLHTTVHTETNRLQWTKHHWSFETFGAICSYLSKVSKFYPSNEFSLEFSFVKAEQTQCFILSIFAGLIFTMTYFAIFIIFINLANLCKSQPIEYSELQCYDSHGWQEPGYVPTNMVIRVVDLSKEG